jgi:hypothetical protein
LGVLLVALFLLLAVVAPRIVSDESIQVRLRDEFARATGGTLDFDRIGITLFPVPGVVAHRAKITIPELCQGTLESVKLYPRILPLFRGKVHVGGLRIEQPAFELDLAELKDLGRKTGEAPSASLDRKAASLFEVLATKVPNLNVEIEGARIDVLEEGQPVLSIRDLRVGAVLPPVGPEIRMTCRSNAWKSLSVDGHIDAESLQGAGRLELVRFQPQLLAARFFPDAGIACSESDLYLFVDVQTDDLRAFRGEVKTSVPQMTLSRAGEQAVIKVDNLGLTFSIEQDRATVSLDQLRLDHPRLAMSGRLLVDKSAPEFRLDFEARDLDVASVRQVALCLGGDRRVVRDIFEYVRSGEIPVITFRSRAPRIDQLGKDRFFRIEGRLENGKIHIRGPDLDPEEVFGEVVISGGILHGEDLKARLGNSRADGGALRVGLKGKDAPFRLQMDVDADVAEVRPILLRVIEPGTFVRELALVANLEGRALGSMLLEGSLQSIQARVEVSECRMSGDHQRIPYAIRIDEGEVTYEKDSIRLTNVKGALGASSFSGLTFRLGFGESPRLEIDSGELQLVMDEIYPWLISYESIRRDLELFREVKGRIGMAEVHLAGPVLKPADWDFEVEAMVENVTVDTRLCPEPVPVSAGSLRATQEALAFNDTNLELLDASIAASGMLHGYLRGLHKVEVDMNGTVGSEAARWVSGIIRLPTELWVRTPFPLSRARLVWNRKGETSFKGDFVLPEGAQGSIDLVQGPEAFLLNSCSLRDEHSRATFSLTRTESAYGMKFTGNLKHTTLDKVFVDSAAPNILLKGDFLLHVRRDKPLFSKAQGHLEAKDFNLPFGWMAPFRIESLSLDASEKGIRVDPARLILEGSHLSMQGEVSFSEEGIQVDMDLASDGIEWDTIERVIDRAKREEPEDGEAPSAWPPVGGTIRCQAESFTYEPFTWTPLQGTVTFSPDTLRVAVTEADMCGIATLGALNLDGEDLSIDLKLIAKDGDLEPTFPCLSDTERKVTGRFDLDGEIKGKAKGDALVQALGGELAFSARNGNILRDPVLAKVFSVLNVTEILRGKMPDLGSNELPYDSLIIQAELQAGNLLLREAVLSGPTVGIVGDGTVYLIDKEVDLKLIVAPLRTVDFIVEKTPVVSNIMGGKLITVPVRIYGDWKDPKVTMLSATAVGSRLLGIMKNTLMLPIDLVEPVLPKQEEAQGSP